MATLKGMTWDHPRGYDPLIAVGPAALKDPGVTVEWDRRSLQDFEHFPLEDLARTYDVIIMDHPHIGDAIASEAVIPMEELLSPERLAALRDDCLAVVWNSYVVNDRTWALPVDAATQVLVWRPGRLDKAPASWDAVLDLARQGRVLLPLRSPHTLMFLYTLMANMGRPFPETGDPDRTVMAEALRKMTQMAALVPAACRTMDPIGAHEALAAGGDHDVIALAYGYSTYGIDGFRPHRLRFAEFPGPNGPRGTTLGGTGLAVSRFGKNPELASAYAANVASQAWQRQIVAPAGGQPSSLGAERDASVDAHFNGFWSGTAQTLSTAWIRPRHTGYVGFQEGASDLVLACIEGKLGTDACIDAISQAFRKTLGSQEPKS